MHRWWQRRGRRATVAELQRALDACRIAYIPEEFYDRHSSFITYTDTEDDLDVGQVCNSLCLSLSVSLSLCLSLSLSLSLPLSLSILTAISRFTWISRCLLKQRMMEVVVTAGLLEL